MNNYAVVQKRGDVSFMVAVFMAGFDAQRYADEQNHGQAYTFEVVEIPHNGDWDNLESLALKGGLKPCAT